MHDVLDPCDTVPDELEQLLTSGHVVPEALRTAVHEAARVRDAGALRGLLDDLGSQARRDPAWAYEEPEDLAGILAAMPAVERRDAPSARPAEAALREKVHGAWLGRCAGCCLGKPVEGLTPQQVRGYLKAADAWPLRDYVPLLDPLPEGIERLNPSWRTATRGRVTTMPRDDDTDYTILALHMLETYGRGLRVEDVAFEWLDKLPFLQTFTAERATYRNIVAGVPVVGAGTHDNPYREWIGALIRADLFGYVNPGDPRAAVELAFVDASLSHTANGVYGELWAAALVAGAFVATDARDALLRSLDWVPAGSRLDETLRHVAAMHREGASWDDAVAWVDERFADHSWVHTLNNAAVIAAALLWGGDDVALTLGLGVQAGLDTDSATATIGSVLGAVHGASGLPGRLVDPLADRIESAVRGYDGSRISELADRTIALVTT
ncbi:ADP-ribosylglycohydrolase family protein [Oerskovia turbata]